MYGHWKTHKVVPRDRGRPNTINVNEAKSAVWNVSDQRSSSSSAFTLSIMKYTVKNKNKAQAEKDGLGTQDSLFVWSKQTMSELIKRSGDLKRLQLDAVLYLWELCYDITLAKSDNVSVSPGFESLGLKVNQKKRNVNEI